MFAWQPFDYDPLGEAFRMQRELQNEFDKLLLSGSATRPLTIAGPSSMDTTEEGPMWKPRTDIRETDKETIVYMELPGLKSEDISICLQEGNLHVSGERKPDLEEEEAIAWQTMEIPFGPFVRDIRVPLGTDAKLVKATFENGILTIRIRKPERFRAIPISAEEKVKGKEKVLGEHEDVSKLPQEGGLNRGGTEGVSGGQPERPREEFAAGRSSQESGMKPEERQPEGTSQLGPGARMTEKQTERVTETTHEAQGFRDQGKQAPPEQTFTSERRDTQQTTPTTV